MEIFGLTIDVMSMMFLLMIVGYVLRKANILPNDTSDVTLARLETYVFVPALNFYSWATSCTVDSLKENWKLVLYGTSAIIVMILLSYPLSKLFVKDDAYQRNIYKYSLVFSNFGFLGNFVILVIFGNEGLFKYSMFTLIMTFLVNSWGICVLIPQSKKPTVRDLMKKIFNPPILGIIAGALVGITGIIHWIPDFMMRAFTNAMNCMGPVGMLLAGFVVAGYEVKELITIKKVYWASLFRLIIIPSVVLSVFKFVLGLDEFALTLALVGYGAPMGLNTIVYPATYGGETRTGAAMAMVSHVFALLTVPLLYYLFIVL